MLNNLATPKIVRDLLSERENWRKNPDYLCFWSSPDNDIGLRLTPTIEDGQIYLDFKIERPHSGFPGISHGGIPFTILDGMMSWFLMSHFGRAGFTRSASVTYNKPLLVGETYRFQVKLDESSDSGGALKLVGEVYSTRDCDQTASLLTMQAKFILPSRVVAEAVLGKRLVAAAGDLFPKD